MSDEKGPDSVAEATYEALKLKNILKGFMASMYPQEFRDNDGDFSEK